MVSCLPIPLFENVCATDIRAVVKGVQDSPALSVFVWQDGAPFDLMMNRYMSAQLPAGIDPIDPMTLQSNFLSLGNLTTDGLLLTGNVSIS